MGRLKGSLNKSTLLAEHGTLVRYRSWRCRCRLCRAANARRGVEEHRRRKYDPAYQARCWSAGLRNRYGIDAQQYQALHHDQNGLCAICGRACPSGKRLAVDHDHESLEVRGLLCLSCNVHLGWYENHVDNVVEYMTHLSQFEAERP